MLFALSVAISIAFLCMELHIAGQFGGALDDAWIHFTIARNVATGDGWTFNPGIITGASTAPLYTLLLAAGCYALGDVIIWSKILGIAMLCVTAYGAIMVVRHLCPLDHRPAYVIGLWVVLSPSLQWAACSGMEITTYLALATVGLALVYSRYPLWGVAALALSVWCRPDGGWLLAVTFLAIPPRMWMKALAVSMAVLLPYVAFNYIVGGSLLPGTVSAKGGFSYSLERVIRWYRELLNLHGVPYGRYEINHSILWLPLWVAGAVWTWRRTYALTIFVVSFPLVFSLFYPNASSHQRYLMPTIPAAMALGVVGLHRLSQVAKEKVARRAFIGAAAVLLCWTGLLLPHKATVLGWNVQNINTMHVALAKWLNANTNAEDVIAVNDIGAIGYHADRQIVDLCGLVSPPLSFWENIETHDPDYVVIFPEWYLEEVQDARFKDAYRPIAAVRLERNTVASRSIMIVYGRCGAKAPAIE